MFRRAVRKAREGPAQSRAVRCSVGCGGLADPIYINVPHPWCCKKCWQTDGETHEEECDMYVKPSMRPPAAFPATLHDGAKEQRKPKITFCDSYSAPCTCPDVDHDEAPKYAHTGSCRGQGRSVDAWHSAASDGKPATCPCCSTPLQCPLCTQDGSLNAAATGASGAPRKVM